MPFQGESSFAPIFFFFCILERMKRKKKNHSMIHHYLHETTAKIKILKSICHTFSFLILLVSLFS